MIATDELRDAVLGDVLSPDDAQWADATRGHNTALQHRPALVLRAAAVTDVAAGVAFAHRHDIPVMVQATGHGPVTVMTGGLLIRTDLLTGIEIDENAKTATVEPGVRWGALMAACAAHELAPPGMGSVASVGVIGYTVGGGMGPFARAQGYAADHVRSCQLVGADGRERLVDSAHEPDLFWAIRGGRIGLGIVTSLTLPLEQAPVVHASTLVFSREGVAEALVAYASWQQTLPEQTSAGATIFRFPDVPAVPAHLRGQRLLQVEVTHIGPDAQPATAAVDQLAETTNPVTRSDRSVDPSTWLHTQMAPPAGPSWARGFVIDRLDPDAIAQLLAIAGPETNAPWQVLELRPMGGALAREPAQPNAADVRSDGVLINTVCAGDPAAFVALPGVHAQLVRALGSHVQPCTPVNFHGVVNDSRPLSGAWSADTSARLDAIRKDIDPTGRFMPCR